jgi:hypothetical protein
MCAASQYEEHYDAMLEKLQSQMSAALADIERLRSAEALDAVQARGAAQKRYLDALNALKILTPRIMR